MKTSFRNRCWIGGAIISTFAAVAVLNTGFVSEGGSRQSVRVMLRGARAIDKERTVHAHASVPIISCNHSGKFNAGERCCNMHFWEQSAPLMKWRLEQPGKVTVMNGREWITSSLDGADGHICAAFHADCVEVMANLAAVLRDEVREANANRREMICVEASGIDGRDKLVVTIDAKADERNTARYLNRCLGAVDTKRVYRFDKATGLLESLDITLTGSLAPTLVIGPIEYGNTMPDELWHLAGGKPTMVVKN